MTEFVDAFLGEAGYAESTRASYRYALLRLAAWLRARGLGLDDLTVGQYQAFLEGHEWSSNMRRMYAAAIRVFLRWMGYREHPILRQKMPKDNAKPGRSLSLEQLNDLLASFDTSTALGWRNLAMVALMAETGLRAAEVCRLKLVDVDLEKRSFVGIVKRQKWGEGVMSEPVAMYLGMWLGARGCFARAGVREVFVSLNGKTQGRKMTPAGLRKLFRGWGVRADVGRLSPHDLRRTMAMLLTEAGAPSRLVQELGRWEDIRMVERYTQRLKPQQIDRYSPVVTLMRS